jgi:FkbM family methyltransferase
MDDLLIWCYRRLGPIARRLGIQKPSRRAYERISALWYSRGQVCTARQNGRVWKLRHDVAERGEEVEIETINWFRSVIKPGMTTIDIGANVGMMTLEMAVLAGPQGRVVAIEPGPDNLDCLRLHMRANGLEDQVKIVDAAVADEDGGEITLFIATTDGVSSLGTGHGVVGAAPILQHDKRLRVIERQVSRVSLDALSTRLGVSPSVIKIDVEGAEIMVLRGAQETIRRHRPCIRVAFHPFAFDDPQAASRELFSIVAAHNYRLEGAAVGETLTLAEYNLYPL